MKKILSWILITSFISYNIGCYSLQEISKEEFEARTDKNEATLFTKDMETYQLNKSQYYIKADTIYAIGNKIVDGDNKIPFNGKIPLENVSVISIKESDGLATTFLVIGIIAGAAIIAGVVIINSAVNEIAN